MCEKLKYLKIYLDVYMYVYMYIYIHTFVHICLLESYLLCKCCNFLLFFKETKTLRDSDPIYLEWGQASGIRT